MSVQSSPQSRRRFISQSGSIVAASFVPACWVHGDLRPESQIGYVVGEPAVEGVGMNVLADGGNAVDALVATALAGAITQLHQTGIGGYGAHGIFAMSNSQRVEAIDANTRAPEAFTRDIFKPEANGRVPGDRNNRGWLAAGVPGVIAGLKLALDQFGTLSFADVLEPAIALAREGFPISTSMASRIASTRASFEKDVGSARLYLPGGTVPRAGALFRNPELADMLTSLAQANSIDPFYRGDIAIRISVGFEKNGGLLKASDLAGYQAQVVRPLQMQWGDYTIHTPPLTCGGISVLQMLAILKALNWDAIQSDRKRLLLQVEAMRLAWRDRLTLLGDPEFGPGLNDHLITEDYAKECADKILVAVDAGKILEPNFKTTTQGGTLSFSACDKHGNMAAMTLTHGDSFGSHVTVEGLGLTLGHGMSRFDTRPDHPNAPGSRKRPVHNMVPAIVTKGTQPVVAIGGRGGRRIPNAMMEFLTQYVARRKPFAESLSSPRIHTEGSKLIDYQKELPKVCTDAMIDAGYVIRTGGVATLSGVTNENGKWQAGMA